MRPRLALLGGGLIVAALVANYFHLGSLSGRVYLPGPIQAVESAVVPQSEGPVQAPADMRLIIPSIGVNAPVDLLGKDAKGEIQAPSKWNDVGWYDLGPAPGAPGVAIIMGHVDSHTGPAVFIHLDRLRPGNRVLVDMAGQRHTFEVTHSQNYPETALPLSRLFVDTGPSQLALLTCSGDFIRQVGRYNDRLVVLTRLAS